jgi:hypothetical protein
MPLVAHPPAVAIPPIVSGTGRRFPGVVSPPSVKIRKFSLRPIYEKEKKT